MATTADWPTYQGFLTAAADALASGDFLGARRAALQAKCVALALGGSVSASGTRVDLLISEAGKLMDEITAVQIQQNAQAGNGRFIKTGLMNSDRYFGNPTGGDGGGVIHD